MMDGSHGLIESRLYDVGIDYGTQVDPGYEGSPFPFTGELDKVVIELTD